MVETKSFILLNLSIRHSLLYRMTLLELMFLMNCASPLSEEALGNYPELSTPFCPTTKGRKRKKEGTT